MHRHLSVHRRAIGIGHRQAGELRATLNQTFPFVNLGVSEADPVSRTIDMSGYIEAEGLSADRINVRGKIGLSRP
jgi:hypothetical protein